MTTVTATFDTSYVAARATAVDAGESDTRAGLERLCADGLLDGDVGGPDYTASFEVIRALARSCVATAFSAWAHRMAVEYLAQWPTPVGTEELLPALRSGSRPGATAMASALAERLGVGTLDVEVRLGGGSVVLDGTIRWASNLYRDAVVVLPGLTADGGRAVVAVPIDTAGVTVAPPPPLLALDGTASSSFRLEAVHLDAGHVLATDVDAFLAGVRRPFLLLQSAFCVGLAEAALDGVVLDGVNAVFGGEAEELRTRLSALRSALADLLADSHAAQSTVVSARLRAAELAGDATSLEGRTRGGAGYVRTSATARRLREAAFLPIQSPTEAQLRWELSNCTS